MAGMSWVGLFRGIWNPKNKGAPKVSRAVYYGLWGNLGVHSAGSSVVIWPRWEV